jgi:hypothetical protein
MSHCTLYNVRTVQYVKPPIKIGTTGSVGTLAAARKPTTIGKPVTSGPPVTACLKGTAETPSTPGTPGTPAIAKRPTTGNHQEVKGLQQQQECLPQSGYKRFDTNTTRLNLTAASFT